MQEPCSSSKFHNMELTTPVPGLIHASGPCVELSNSTALSPFKLVPALIKKKQEVQSPTGRICTYFYSSGSPETEKSKHVHTYTYTPVNKIRNIMMVLDLWFNHVTCSPWGVQFFAMSEPATDQPNAVFASTHPQSLKPQSLKHSPQNPKAYTPVCLKPVPEFLKKSSLDSSFDPYGPRCRH